jgi:hypothetical protein
VLENTPIPIRTLSNRTEVLGNMATLSPAVMPVVINHHNGAPVFDIYANTQDDDLGSVAAKSNRIVMEESKILPLGTKIIVRGQVESMNEAFNRLGLGLVFAALLVYQLMVVNYQSWLDPFIIICALPGGRGGPMNRSGRMHRSRRINFRGGRRSTWCLGGAPVVAEEIAGDAKEIAAGFHFAVAGRGGAEETDVAFLHEVVGEGGVAGDSGEIGPEGTGGTLVEGGKSFAGLFTGLFTLHGGSEACTVSVISTRGRTKSQFMRNLAGAGWRFASWSSWMSWAPIS